MGMSDNSPYEVRISSAQLGGPAAPDVTLCSAKVVELLSAAAGEGMRMASLSLDVTSFALGEAEVSVAVRVDKRARSIVFASAEARSGEQLVFSAQGLFSRVG
jgi:hypothetical protein